MKNVSSWINGLFVLFGLLLALEPIMQSADIYWYLIALLCLIGFIALLGCIFGIFKQTISIPAFLAKARRYSFVNVLVIVVGIVVGYVYQSTLFKFWLLMLFMELVFVFSQRYKKE